jgi:phospholipid-binding lipoprotein MlaA
MHLGMVRRFIAMLTILAALTACAGQPKDSTESMAPGTPGGSANEPAELGFEEDDDNDPLETLNRFIFAFDLTLDVFILKPVAATYRFMAPMVVRDSVRNVLRNLRTPVVLANDLFQGEMDRAEDTTMRFLINTTVGLLGILDVADGWGYPHHDEDFGQTLAVHGSGEGFYLVLPLFGPSSVRDGVGLLVDTFLDPLTYVGQIYDVDNELMARTVVDGVDERSRNIETLEDLQKDSIDFYARIRSLYRQTRANDIRNGANGDSASPGLYSSEFKFGDDANTPEKPAE